MTNQQRKDSGRNETERAAAEDQRSPGRRDSQLKNSKRSWKPSPKRSKAGEVELRAAIALGDDPVLPVTHEKGDGESAEIRSLSEKSELREAIKSVANGKAISGPVKELAEARGLTEANAIPWDVIAPRVEHRARVEHRVDVVTSDTADVQGKEQHTILQRVFARSRARWRSA